MDAKWVRKRSSEIGSGAESHDEDDGEEPRFKDSANRFMADCEESSQRYFILSSFACELSSFLLPL